MFSTEIKKNSALLVIDIQQENFKDMTKENYSDPRWDTIKNAKRVLDVFRAKNSRLFKCKRFIELIW